jgi:hypothetical protein
MNNSYTLYTHPYATQIVSQLQIIESENRKKCINLLSYFIEKYPKAKGSSHNHQAYDFGYYVHICDIFSYANKLYPILSGFSHPPQTATPTTRIVPRVYRTQKRSILIDGVEKLFSIEDVILVLFLHDIEKPVKYSGEVISENDELIKEKIINQFQIKLSEEQKMAIKYIHGEGNDYKKDKRVMSPLCAFCHCCDVISARIFYE